MEEDKKTKKLVSSSMVDLKAELFRKQEEFKRQKEVNTAFIKAKKTEKDKKGGIWSKQNSGVLARAQRDLEAGEKDLEEEEMLAKSRRILEQKSRVYDSISSSSTIPEEDGSEYYLVDFQKKAIDALVEEREVSRRAKHDREEEEAERKALAEEIPQASCPDDEWVDFVDSLGRDRRCMRKDLNQLMKKDQELALAQTNKKKSSAKPGSIQDLGTTGDGPLPHLMSADMHREMMRQKWEDETRHLLDSGQEEVHYSNVQFDEIRAHGVGYFQFSKDHAKREEELEKLRKLREETKDQQSRKDRIKDKRKAMMEARLAKVRQRRKLKEEVTEEAKPDGNEEDADSIGPKPFEAASSAKTEDEEKKEEETKEAEEKRKSHVREWDKEKMKDSAWGARNYVASRRAERDSDFAPPSAYFEEKTHSGKPANPTGGLSNKDRMKRLQETVSRSSNSHAVDEDQSTREESFESAPLAPEDKPSSSGSSLAVNSIPMPSETARATQGGDHDASSKMIGQGTQPRPGPMSQTVSADPKYSYQTGPHISQQYHGRQGAALAQQWSTGPAQQYTGEQSSMSQEWTHTQGGPAQQYSGEQSMMSQHWTHTQVGARPPWHPSGGQAAVASQQWHHAYAGTQPQQRYPDGQVWPQSQSHWNPAPSSAQPVQQYQNMEANHPPQNWIADRARASTANPQPAAPPVTNNPSFTQSLDASTPSANPRNQPRATHFTHSESSDKPSPPKKPKVPKLSIVDTRYVNNFDTASINPEPGRVPDVGGVPYKPGSFSKYRPHGEAGDSNAAVEPTDADTETQRGAQISGGPLIYTKEQLERQQQELDQQTEDTDDANADDDSKLQDFLASIRASTG